MRLRGSSSLKGSEFLDETRVANFGAFSFDAEKGLSI
jgi:hypothetical protein